MELGSLTVTTSAGHIRKEKERAPCLRIAPGTQGMDNQHAQKGG